VKLTLRDSTEWVETVEAGVNQIVGADPDKIAQAIRDVEERYESIKKRFTPNPFGDGQAARRIVKAIESFAHLAHNLKINIIPARLRILTDKYSHTIM